MSETVTTLNLAELLAAALFMGIIAAGILASMLAVCWLIYEAMSDEVGRTPQSKADIDTGASGGVNTE